MNETKNDALRRRCADLEEARDSAIKTIAEVSALHDKASLKIDGLSAQVSALEKQRMDLRLAVGKAATFIIERFAQAEGWPDEKVEALYNKLLDVLKQTALSPTPGQEVAKDE